MRQSFGLRRRRPGLKPVTSPKRWEVGRVDVIDGITLTEADPSAVLFIPLAQIFDRVGDATTGPGRTLSNMARSMEVGGVVLDYSMILSPNQDVPPPGAGVFNRVDMKMCVASDRLFEDGTVAALAPNFWTNTTPVTTAANSTIEDEDAKFPERIHYEDTFFNQVNRNDPTGPLSGAWPSTQQQVRTAGRCNLRLKLRLDDFHALGVYFAAIWRFATADFAEMNALVRLNGKIYYRIRF